MVDAPVVDLRNPHAGGPFLLVCEHASNRIPEIHGDLGLDAAARSSHIAWDPGALAVAQEMARLLDAPLVAGGVSRLLYDCNRPPEAPSAVPQESEVYRIPGNQGLSEAALRARAELYYFPFRAALAGAVEAHAARVGGRAGAGAPAIVTVHSFTPVYRGVARQVEIGILHDEDARLADAMLAAAAGRTGLVVRRNEPYGPQDGVTHTLREHTLPRGLLNVMIEVRNDLIASEHDAHAMAATLAGWLETALAACRQVEG